MRAAVHVGQLLQPVPGGIGRYVRGLLAALPGAGVEVEAFAAGPPPDGVRGYTDLGWPSGPARYETWHRFRRPLIRVPGDVVHATSLAIPPAGRRPLVVTVHDLVFLRTPEHLTSRGVAFHRRGLDLARSEGNAIVVPSAYGRGDLVAEGFDPDRIVVAHHGVDAPADVTSIRGRPPFVLFVGTLEPRKGVPDLLAAHAALRTSIPDLELVLVGRNGWGEPLDLSPPGVVTGPVDDDELDLLYRAATALALPSRYEGFGFPVIEAMARGCPVVASDAACLPEITGGAADLVPVGDVDALAEALGRLLDDESYRARRVVAGRVRAADFTWEASAAAHARAYAMASNSSACA